MPPQPVAQGAATDPHRPLGLQPLHHLAQRDVLARIDQLDDLGFMRIDTWKRVGGLADAPSARRSSPVRSNGLRSISRPRTAPRLAAPTCPQPKPSNPTTEDRRFSALAIIHLIKVDVDSPAKAVVTSH
ncbi:hypothetical protein BQ8794_240209 [Mesorhizobium prunaredense]|uniref:Uncharacterized protein n=1 Tax=Mesorhizobium prunaredense TaxID=1631249 RepID=A0A1R3V852_9HYPH|nr:hypothetical protein BQ8794_240209 [Mesorhizobium prunaredense]